MIDTTNMCSHLQKKLFDEDGIYHPLWAAIQDDNELTAVVRSRQLHIYRNGKKVLVLAGKTAPKVIREDSICELLQVERIRWMEQRFDKALAAIKDGSADSLKAIQEDVAELSKYYGSELWKLDFAADEAGKLPPDLKRGVLSEDGIWNLLPDYREIEKINGDTMPYHRDSEGHPQTDRQEFRGYGACDVLRTKMKHT